MDPPLTTAGDDRQMDPRFRGMTTKRIFGYRFMFRWMCKSKIHRVTITEARLDYEGSITIDASLLEAADIKSYEMVQVLNINNGQRFETYAIPGKKGSGVVCLNGAAARLGVAGDKAIVISSCLIPEADTSSFLPKIVFVNEKNQMVPQSQKVR